jgi:predicted DNA-binding protein (MmcQ/YjbR family)
MANRFSVDCHLSLQPSSDVMGQPNRQRGKEEQQMIERVAALSAPWPSVSSGVDGFGHMTFRAGKKSFVIIGAGEHGDGSMAIKSDPVNQDALVRTGRFKRTPYIGQHGWVSVESGRKLDWSELEPLIADAYESVAPKKKVGRKNSGAQAKPVVSKKTATKKTAVKKTGVKKAASKKSPARKRSSPRNKSK